MTTWVVDGPYFEDLQVGQVFDDSPAVTLTSGLTSAHQAIVGNRLQVTLDEGLSRHVAGDGRMLVSPAVVWDVSIGQSTPATHTVIANLYYRNLVLLQMPRIGDTLTTVTTVEGLRGNRSKPGREPSGLALLHIVTTNQRGDVVLDFYRCAMIAARTVAPDVAVRGTWDLQAAGSDAVTAPSWDLSPVRERHGRVNLVVGDEYDVAGGDVVSSAAELARLTQNIAKVHHDERYRGERLVYGGHSIGLALHQVVRALPSLVTVIGWKSCDHTGPVREGDTLRTRVVVEGVGESDEHVIAGLRALVVASSDARADTDVLDWRFDALFA
ncbi:MaoC family dehydratase [Aeromicrobium sp. P5_D10]